MMHCLRTWKGGGVGGHSKGYESPARRDLGQRAVVARDSEMQARVVDHGTKFEQDLHHSKTGLRTRCACPVDVVQPRQIDERAAARRSLHNMKAAAGSRADLWRLQNPDVDYSMTIEMEASVGEEYY
jgi:hypothetical protein